MKKINQIQFKWHNMQNLNRQQLRNIMAGTQSKTTVTMDCLACCEVKCSNGQVKSRDCGNGVVCTTSGTTIFCGSDSQEMC